jgi:hypothetical protein
MQIRTSLRNAFAAFIVLSCSLAQAQIFRAYLDSTGSDANPCTLQQPCRLLPAALSAVANGGEIWMLDSANFNTAPVTVNKSVSILAVPGAVGSVVANGGPALTINSTGLSISLRNLVIVPLPGTGATSGVYMTGASTLTIDGCLLANLPGSGVYAFGTGKVRIINSVIRNVGAYGVEVANGVSVDIAQTQFVSNVAGGVYALGGNASTTTVTVSDSAIIGMANASGDVGVFTYATANNAIARVFVTRTTISGTSYPLDGETNNSTGALGVITVSNSMVTNNSFAWYQNGTGSAVRSLGNNHLIDNSSFVGTLSTASLQ